MNPILNNPRPLQARSPANSEFSLCSISPSDSASQTGSSSRHHAASPVPHAVDHHFPRDVAMTDAYNNYGVNAMPSSPAAMVGGPVGGAYQWVESFDPMSGAICGQWVCSAAAGVMMPPPGMMMAGPPPPGTMVGPGMVAGTIPSSSAMGGWAGAEMLGGAGAMMAGGYYPAGMNAGMNAMNTFSEQAPAAKKQVSSSTTPRNGQSNVSVLVSNLALHTSPAILKQWFEDRLLELRPKEVREP